MISAGVRAGCRATRDKVTCLGAPFREPCLRGYAERRD